MGRYSPLSGSDPWYTDDLVASYRPGQKESCIKTGSAWLSPTQEKRPLHQEWSCAVIAAHSLMMHYACPIWRSVSCSHVRKLQVLQSNCLRIATGAPWYISNVQIHEDFGVPFFAEHIRALTESYDSKLAGVGNPFSATRQIFTQTEA
jgi:hypothetical protein